MNFQGLQNEVGSQTRFDVSVSGNLTLVKRWINRAQQYIAGTHDWSWLQTREIIQTIADKTAGTVTTLAVSGVSVVGSGTSWASADEGSYIQFSTSNDWYRILQVVSTTNLVIEVAYTQTTAISSGSPATYIIRKFYYPFGSDVDRVLSVRQAITPVKLYPMPFISLSRWTPFHSVTGKPYLYATAGLDQILSGGSSDTINFNKWTIQFYPWPDGVYNMEVDFLRAMTDLSANGDSGSIPVKMRDTVLVDGAVAYGYQYLNDPRYTAMWQKFEQGIERMWIQDGQNRAAMQVIEAVDNTTQDPDLIRYPSGYPFIDGY